LLAGFCAFLFFYGLAQFGLIGADEPRYAQVAREMLERHDWVTPTLGGQPWLEKPPVYYWQAMLAYSIFGVSDWSARLPSGVDATLLVLAVYFFLRRFRPGSEVDGALMTASCAGIIAYGRAASTDMALTAAFGMGMLGWWAWRESGQRIYLTGFYGSMALGTLAKGPVAPFLAALVIILYAIAVRDRRVVVKTLWLPGIVLFCAIALPWYIAVQMRHPQFFYEFIVEHNFQRFSTNLYHHVEPFWYYLPVTILGFVPWTVFVIAAVVRTVRTWFAEPGLARDQVDHQFGLFVCCWLVVPVIFFSFSESKLSGYILPAIPAGALLLADYLRQRLQQASAAGAGPENKAANSALEAPRHPKGRAESLGADTEISRIDDRENTALVLLHALVAAGPIVPALLIAYVITQHRLPGGRPMLAALAIAFILCAGIALTLIRRDGPRMFRFVTLIPVVIVVGAVLKLGSLSLDRALSARPLAREIAAMEMHPLPLAIYHVRRELEYGLTFYRNRLTFNYAWGSVPLQEHLLVAPENSQAQIAGLVPGRRVSYLGHYAEQHVDYYWIGAAVSAH